MKLFPLEDLHFAIGVAPDADALAGTVTSDILSLKDYGTLTFVVQKGAGATGTTLITVEASDDVSASNVEAIPFKYRAVTTGDTLGALTDATTAGFTTTAGANQLYIISIEAEELLASGYQFARLKAVEVANDPCDAAVLAFGSNPRYGVDKTMIS